MLLVFLVISSRTAIDQSGGWDGASNGSPPTPTISIMTITCRSRRSSRRKAKPITIMQRPGMSVFYRDAEGAVFHTYSCYGRGLDMMNTAYHHPTWSRKGATRPSCPSPWPGCATATNTALDRVLARCGEFRLDYTGLQDWFGLRWDSRQQHDHGLRNRRRPSASRRNGAERHALERAGSAGAAAARQRARPALVRGLPPR